MVVPLWRLVDENTVRGTVWGELCRVLQTSGEAAYQHRVARVVYAFVHPCEPVGMAQEIRFHRHRAFPTNPIRSTALPNAYENLAVDVLGQRGLEAVWALRILSPAHRSNNTTSRPWVLGCPMTI